MTGRVDRRLIWLAFAAVTVAGAVSAYLQVFSQFAYYDDEGYVLTSLREFVSGGDLYGTVYTQYGPVFYELFGGLYKLTGIEITNDSGRLVVVALWTAIATGYGLAAWRISASAIVGLITQTLCFGALSALAAEPMHPHGLATLLVFGAIALVWLTPGRRGQFALGAVIAALLLVKINLGVLVALAVLLAVLLRHAPRDRRDAIRLAGLAVVALAVVALGAKSLNQQWAQKLVLTELVAICAIALRCFDHDGERSIARLLDALRPLLLGAIALTVPVVLVILALGTSPADLFRGLFLDPPKQADVLVVAFPLPDAVVGWSAAALVAAFATVRLDALPIGAQARLRLSVGLRALAAGAVVVSLIGVAPLTIGPHSGKLILPMLFAWIVAVPPREIAESDFRSFARLATVLIAVLGVMQAYPVAVSQLKIASVPFVAVGAIAAMDALGLCRKARLADRDVGAFALATLAACLIFAVIWPLQDARRRYAAGVRPNLHGATLLRLGAGQAAAYEQMTRAVRSCPEFETLPGLNSLFIWSRKRPPSGQRATSWMLQFNERRQRITADALTRSGSYCLLRNQAAEDLARGASKFSVVPERSLHALFDQPGLKPDATFNDGKVGTWVLYRVGRR